MVLDQDIGFSSTSFSPGLDRPLVLIDVQIVYDHG